MFVIIEYSNFKLGKFWRMLERNQEADLSKTWYLVLHSCKQMEI